MASAFVIERIFHAPVNRIWQALTDREEMKKWYFDIPAFKPEVGFEFQFYGQGHKGEQYLHLCRITDVIPGRKLRYSWQYDKYEGISFVTFELFREGENTRLVLTHEGLETFPQNNADFARESFAEGWTYLVTKSLNDYLG
jgi:uncharacterized protein YndB with AHSA1/START domain